MARGAIVKEGVVVDVLEVASDYDPNYGGKGIAFIPDVKVEVGDIWDGSKFIYQLKLTATETKVREAIETALNQLFR